MNSPPLITGASRFPINTTINDLVNDLFVENWLTAVNYSLYFDQCSPKLCSYTYIQELNSFYTVTSVLSISGGIMFILKWISPILVRLLVAINRYRKKRTNVVQCESNIPMTTITTVDIMPRQMNIQPEAINLQSESNDLPPPTHCGSFLLCFRELICWIILIFVVLFMIVLSFLTIIPHAKNEAVISASSSSCQLTFELLTRQVDSRQAEGSIAVSDFDNDGLWDIILTLFRQYTNIVVFGDGYDSFTRSITINTACSTTGTYVIAADINNDAQMDIVTACDGGPNIVSIILGNGDGTFREAIVYSTGEDGYAIWLDTGDFNGDGNLDIVASIYGISGNRTVEVLFGDGNGFIGGHTRFSTGQNDPSWSLVVGDFDNDRQLDIAIGKFYVPQIVVLLGYGNGSFGPPIINELESIIFFASWIDAVDINNDGYLDVIVTNAGLDNVAVLLGKGDGTFQPSMTFSTGVFGAPYSGVVEDFNGDGVLDIAAVNYATANVGVLLGYGNGTFGPPMMFPIYDSRMLGMIAADFNRDGRMDLAFIGLASLYVPIMQNTCECCEQEFFNMSRTIHQ
ncbi:unnamed protein product [Adineta steineri]|uniref:Uncharacterized protein n=1 Tax=Adineta steineri TaxID=433720 RepID=A0A815QPV2_9BILA|nr:unnamed protein product [Adineta steineri]